MALAASRNTPERAAQILEAIPVKAATIVYTGSLCAVDSSGWGVPASDTAGLIVLGRCEGIPGPGLTGLDGNNAGGANGAVLINVKRGCFKFANGTSGELLATADIGRTCYVVDDQTVGKLGGTNKVTAGVVVGLDDSAASVWVEIRGNRLAGYAQTQVALTDNTTGAVSTTLASISDAATKNAVASINAQLVLIKADIAAILK